MGFVQTPTFEEPYLHFIRETDGNEVIYEKSNKLSIEGSKGILAKCHRTLLGSAWDSTQTWDPTCQIPFL
jgi:hypothetical protein